MDANPEAFLTHLGTAASVGAILDDEAGWLTDHLSRSTAQPQHRPP